MGTQNVKGKAKKGEARTDYEEVKIRVNMTLTQTAIASLDAKAQEEGISRSELIERYARSLVEGRG
jgi:predicted DNA binding CopG/RHH family protein